MSVFRNQKFISAILPWYFFLGVCRFASGEQAIFSDIHVDKKPGQEIGSAVVTINGKLKQLTHHALNAWPIMDGQNALVLVPGTKNAPSEYHLRFYEGATRRFRDLGAVPLASPELLQRKQSNGDGSLYLPANGKPVIVAAGLNGVHGLLRQNFRPTPSTLPLHRARPKPCRQRRCSLRTWLLSIR